MITYIISDFSKNSCVLDIERYSKTSTTRARDKFSKLRTIPGTTRTSICPGTLFLLARNVWLRAKISPFTLPRRISSCSHSCSHSRGRDYRRIYDWNSARPRKVAWKRERMKGKRAKIKKKQLARQKNDVENGAGRRRREGWKRRDRRVGEGASLVKFGIWHNQRPPSVSPLVPPVARSLRSDRLRIGSPRNRENVRLSLLLRERASKFRCSALSNVKWCWTNVFICLSSALVLFLSPLCFIWNSLTLTFIEFPFEILKVA